ncbi:MarR family transcriptional regulator [Nakamurella endophytica]|uniref:MarR family transcriptional regulator n=1 Tax=Nakamurella endophytica TaxID=1748367 RepID=A0A917WE08_9ACTN|nr:MarR family transcriptional regulator [Nakamurella endophytica]
MWREYIETAERLRSRLAARLQAESSLSIGDYQVLLALSEARPRALRSSELAATIGWERSRLSHHLGRMERRDLVRRDECATDNRGAEISLTDTGERAFRAATVPHLRAVREVFVDAFTAPQLDHLAAATGALRSHLAESDS